MSRRILPTIVFVLAGSVCLASEPPTNGNKGWQLASERNGVLIYSRPRAGSPLKEFKAIGEIGASSRAVQEVLDDIETYPSFMPYNAECRLLKRESDSVIAYQRFSPPICSDRDYTLRVYRTSWPAADGVVYSSHWEPANGLGPAKKPGVVRVNVCEGTWLLEPDGANKTRATYCIYTETGGLVASFIANHFSQVAIAKLFVAIRNQVKQPKYNGPVR